MVSAVRGRRFLKTKRTMARIYGIDLASEKFDVSFINEQGRHCRPLSCPRARELKNGMLESLDKAIDELEGEIQRLIDSDEDLRRSSGIVRSVPGIGGVTAAELIIKTDNFSRVDTARKCASLAGIAPFPNSTGKRDYGNHVSRFGDLS